MLAKFDPPMATTAPVNVPPSSAVAGMGVLLEATTHRRIQVQLLAAPGCDGASDAPPWSALVVDGVTVTYEDMTRLRMDLRALEFIVEQLPRTFAGTGVLDAGPRMHHLRPSSCIEFDLWRKVLSPPKIVDLEVHNGREMTRGGAREAARSWLTKTEDEWDEVGDDFLAV